MLRTLGIFLCLAFFSAIPLILRGQIGDQAIDEDPEYFNLSYPGWQDSILLVAGDHNYPPYEFLNQDGNPDGFTIGIVKAVAEVMNLNIQIELMPWREVREAVKNRQIDVVTGMYKTTERDRIVDFSIPHFISSYSLFVRKKLKDSNFADLRNKVVLVQEGDLAHDFMVKRYPETRIITFTDLGDVFIALSEGMGDCAFHSRLQGLRFLESNGILNVTDIGKALIQEKYCLAVPEGEAELLAILNEGLSIIKTNGTYDGIYEKWFGVYEDETLHWDDVMRYTLWIVLPLLVLTLVFIVWSYTLKKQVRKSTFELKNELKYRQAIQYQLEQTEKQLRDQNKQLLQRNERIASMNEELGAAKSLAEKNDYLKTAFLANMSHEIRTPMNSIIGFCELLEIEAEDCSIQKYTGIISQSAHRLMHLLDDIIDISKIESGVIGFSISQIRLKTLIIELFDQYSLAAKNKGVELVLESDPSCADYKLTTDPHRLMQVISNFLSNALKHTETGRVVLGCAREEGHIKFWVADTGRGIPNEDLPHIFERFYQANNHQCGGTGLGLAIAKSIVDYFGGEIGVKSKMNKGSLFWFTHPLDSPRKESDENHYQ